MGPNGQNQHLAELGEKVCLYIHSVVLLRGLLSLEGKNELFLGKKRKKLLAKSSQTDYNSPLLKELSFVSFVVSYTTNMSWQLPYPAV